VAILWVLILAAAPAALAQDKEPVAGEPVAGEPTAQPEPIAPLIPPRLLDFPALAFPDGVPFEPHTVTLALVIDEAGAVESVALITGQEPFATLALEAAPLLVFSPATEGGTAVAVELPFTWEFEPPPVVLAGQLRTLGTRDVIPAVTLLVGGQIIETDLEGRFEVRRLPPGDYELRVEDPALEMKPAQFLLVEGQRVDLELWALADPTKGQAVGYYRRRKEHGVHHSLSAEEVRTTPGTMGDPVRAVQNMPGVVRTPFDSGWLLVRGGDPEDTGTFIDGVRVPLIYHLGGFTSVIHPAMVDRVDFMPGGFGVRYGRAIAGAVDLQTKQVEGERRVEAGADIVLSAVYLQTPFGQQEKWGGSFAVRRSYLDRVMALAPGISEEQAAIAPRFWDWQARMDHKRGGVFLIGYSDTIDVPTGDGTETLTVNMGTQRIHGRFEFDSPIGELTLLPVAHLDWRNTEIEGTSDERRDYGIGLRAEHSDDGTGTFGWTAGLDGEAGRYQMRVDDILVESNYASTDPYLALRFGDRETLILGLRLETLFLEDQLARAFPSPRLQASVPFLDRFELVTDAGVYHQYPPFDLATGLPAGPYLHLERSYGVGSGLRWVGDNIQLQVDGFWRQMDYLALFEDDGTLGEGAGRAYGVETLTRWQWRTLSGWLAYTWSRSKRQQEPGDLYLESRYDQPHFLVAVITWDLPKGWTLAARWRYASGYPWDTDVDKAYDILTLEPQDLNFYADQATGRLPPYHALDVKVSRLMTRKRWRLEFYFDLQNAYNRRIPEPIINGIDDTEIIYGFGLPILPIVGLKGVVWP
jgi:hypothetical protein